MEPQLMLDGHLVLSAPPKKPRRHIEDITTWKETFTVFSLVLTSFFPHRCKDLTLYKLLILRIHRQFSGQVWLPYDLNQWAPAPPGSLVCPGTRAGAPPLTRFAAIIVVAARVAAPIIPYRAAQDQIVSRRVLLGADLRPGQLAPRLAKKHGISNCWPTRDWL